MTTLYYEVEAAEQNLFYDIFWLEASLTPKKPFESLKPQNGRDRPRPPEKDPREDTLHVPKHLPTKFQVSRPDSFWVYRLQTFI